MGDRVVDERVKVAWGEPSKDGLTLWIYCDKLAVALVEVIEHDIRDAGVGMLLRNDRFQLPVASAKVMMRCMKDVMQARSGEVSCTVLASSGEA